MPTRQERREHQGKVPGAGFHSPPTTTVPYAPTPKGHAAEKEAESQPGGVHGGPGAGYVPVPYAPTPTGRHAAQAAYTQKLHHEAKEEAAANKRASHAYREEAIKHIATKSYATTSDGKLKTQTVKVPVVKTDEKTIQAAKSNLDHTIAKIKASGASPNVVHAARAAGNLHLVKQNFKITPKGKVATKAVKVPVLKVSPKQVKHELRKVNRKTQEIRTGKRPAPPIIIHGSTIHTTPVGDVVGAVAGGVKGAVVQLGKEFDQASSTPTATGARGTSNLKPALKTSGHILSDALSASMGNRNNPASLNYEGAGPIGDLRRDLRGGVRTGLAYATEYLTRPGLAIEQQISHELAGEPGLSAGLLARLGDVTLTQKGKESLKGASIEQALLHGHGGHGVVTGGDITEQTLGLPQLGLPLDILTDPTMYIGFAGLPAKFAERSVAIADRLKRAAPSVFEGSDFTVMMKRAQASGDYEQIHTWLEAKAAEHKVSLKGLGRSKTDKAEIARFKEMKAERGKEIATQVLKGINHSERIKGEPLYLGGKVGQDAAKEVGRMALEQANKPGFTFEIRTPFGRKLTGIEVPVPKRLAQAKIFPTRGATYAAIGSQTETAKLLQFIRAREATEPLYRGLGDEWKKLKDEVDGATDPKVQREATKNLHAFEDKLQVLRQEARTSALNDPNHAISLEEMFRNKNAKRYAHEVKRMGDAMGRGTQRISFHHESKAMEDLSTEERLRVGAHMNMEADLGHTAPLDKIAPLNAKEQQAVIDQRKIYDELERHGLETGALARGRKNYVPRFITEVDDIAGSLHAGPKSEETIAAGGRQGAKSAHQHARTFAEMASFASRPKLAEAIKYISKEPITTEDALKIADEWHQNSKIRLTMEDLANAVHRGHLMNIDELTDLQKAAYEWSRTTKSNKQLVPPLFHDVESTEGILKLDERGQRYHEMDIEPYSGMNSQDEYRTKLTEAYQSRQALVEARDAAIASTDKNQAVGTAQQWDDIIKQRNEEIKQIKADMHEARTPRLLPADVTNQEAHAAPAVEQPTAPPVTTAEQHQALQDEVATLEGEHERTLARINDARGTFKNKVWTVTRKDAQGEVRLNVRAGSEQEAMDRVVGATKAVEDKSSSKIAKREAVENIKADSEKAEQIEHELEAAQAKLDASHVETPTPTEIRTEPPHPVTDGTEAPTAEEVGLANDAELHDFVPNASADYVQSLKDFRRDHPDKFPIFDPLIANFHRTRAEGLQTAYFARWRGVDAQHGRAESESYGKRYTMTDGRTGVAGDLKPYYGNGEDISDVPIGWTHKGDGEMIPAEDIHFEDRTLIGNTTNDRWVDPQTGREYVRASALNKNVEGAIHQAIGEDRLWPADVVTSLNAEFMRMGEGGIKEFYDIGFDHFLQKVSTQIRYGVTTLFPAYHVRNMISDTLNSMLADPGMLFHPASNSAMTWAVMTRGGKITVPLSGKLAGKEIEFGVGSVKVPTWGKVSSESYLGVMDAFGLRSNQHIAEMAQLSERGSLKDVERWWQGVHSYRRPVQIVKGGFGLGQSGAVGRRAVEFSARREDIIRVLTFTQRMRRNGGDFADAMWWTIKHHFDYADLSQAERRVWRNLFLFYTWYRKNIPLQFASMIRRPGFFSGMTNAYIDLAHGQTPINVNWSQLNPNLPDMSGPAANTGLIPDYMFTQLGALTTNWNGHALSVGFGAPMNDMNMVTHLFENPEEWGRSVFALTNPALSLPVQAIFRKDALTGKEFDINESSGAAKMLDWVQGKFGVDLLARDEEGDPVLPWVLNLAFNAVPIAGRASSYFRGTNPLEDPGRANTWFGGGIGTFLTGLNAIVTPEKGERLDLAYIARVQGRAQQRRSLTEQGATAAEVAAFDKETPEWAKERAIPFKYLQVVSSIGPAYVTQEEREGGYHLSGGSALTGGGSDAGLFGASEGGLGGLPTPKAKEFNSEAEEALDKVKHPGAATGTGVSNPLTGGLPIGEGGEAYQGGVEDPNELNAALSRLHANAEARKAPVPILPVNQRQRELAGFPHTPVLDKANVQANPKKMNAAQKLLNSSAKGIKLDLKSEPKPKALKVANIEGMPDQPSKEFAAALAHYSGLSPEIAAAWTMSEMGAEVSGGGAGKYNYLGVGYPGHKTPLAEEPALNTSPQAAAKFTAEWMKGKVGVEKAGAAIPEILPKSVGKGAQAFVNALATSGWGTDASHVATNLSQVSVNGQIALTGGKTIHVRQDVKHMLKWADATTGTEEGSKLQQKWAAQSGISSSEAWCSAWIAAGLHRLGLPAPSNPAGAGTWQQWKGGKNLHTTDLNKAKPGDIITFGTSDPNGNYADHVGLYVGNGEMISGNFSDSVVRANVADDGAPVQNIIRPNYSGKKVSMVVENTPITAPGGTSSAGGTENAAGETVSPGYHPGRAENQNRLLSRIERGEALGLGSTSSGSSGGSSLLTTTEAYNLGKGTTRPGETIVAKVQRELEGKPPEVIQSRVGRPKFKLKSSKL